MESSRAPRSPTPAVRIASHCYPYAFTSSSPLGFPARPRPSPDFLTSRGTEWCTTRPPSRARRRRSHASSLPLPHLHLRLSPFASPSPYMLSPQCLPLATRFSRTLVRIACLRWTLSRAERANELNERTMSRTDRTHCLSPHPIRIPSPSASYPICLLASTHPISFVAVRFALRCSSRSHPSAARVLHTLSIIIIHHHRHRRTSLICTIQPHASSIPAPARICLFALALFAYLFIILVRHASSEGRRVGRKLGK
ncbi:hypothetical protein PYCCODRAFT_19685 [Trametes coccinea BRFM310]|uniref:Uncharacterized protein n=1 Tax=Trametes coccinea (strain BRFM310) TaxID=1353009 RepID=A0A1Y2J4S9_TRAC3|nr:hypothetical protein PYCCODRAFT_19685 [Trametes coccinea BRFM310]